MTNVLSHDSEITHTDSNMGYENPVEAGFSVDTIDKLKPAVIKVIGVGGGGGNALEYMISQGIEGVEFICANTDAQALKNSHADVVLQLGDPSSRGLGAGANPEVGRKAAEASRDRIHAVLDGADMVFITAGMGGGTGTGAAPVVAEIAKGLRAEKSGILTVAVVTKPFEFEGKKRMEIAEEGIRQLSQYVDSLIVIPNNKLMKVLGKQVSLLEAFKAVNNVLLGAVQGISELITRPGLINVDFADVRTVMSEMGMAMMGTGEAVGENRAREAAEDAITGPLLEDINLSGARGALVIITAGLDLSIGEFEEAGEVIKGVSLEGATIVLGTVLDPEMQDRMRVTVVLTGLDKLPTTVATNTGWAHRIESGPLDYRRFDQPAVLRKNNEFKTDVPSQRPQMDEAHLFDLPAFLRRKSEIKDKQ